MTEPLPVYHTKEADLMCVNVLFQFQTLCRWRVWLATQLFAMMRLVAPFRVVVSMSDD